MDEFNEFLLCYNRIHDTLRTLAGNKTLSFSRALNATSARFARVARVKKELDEYRILRNAIVHDSTQELIAIPCKSTIDRIRAIEQTIRRPSSLLSYLPGRRVFTVSEHNSLAAVMKLFAKTGCSQFPIVANEQIIGLISTEGISHYLSTRLSDGDELLVDLGRCSVKMVLNESSQPDEHGFFDSGLDVYEARERIRQKPTCRLWLITSDGRASGRLLNVCNGFDLPRLLEVG